MPYRIWHLPISPGSPHTIHPEVTTLQTSDTLSMLKLIFFLNIFQKLCTCQFLFMCLFSFRSTAAIRKTYKEGLPWSLYQRGHSPSKTVLSHHVTLFVFISFIKIWNFLNYLFYFFVYHLSSLRYKIYESGYIFLLFVILSTPRIVPDTQ